jgi:hypothetical protein
LQQSESAAAVQVPPKGITLDLTMSIGGQWSPNKILSALLLVDRASHGHGL